MYSIKYYSTLKKKIAIFSDMDGLGGHNAQGNEKDKQKIRRYKPDTSLVFQWLRIHPPITGEMGSTPGQGTKIPRAAG